MQNGAGDSVPTVSNPVAFGETPVHYERAPPLLGEHTAEVLTGLLGLDATQLAQLKADGVI